MTKSSLNTSNQNRNQADVTDCDDLNCGICQQHDQTEAYGKMIDRQQERKAVAQAEIKRIAQVLRNLHIGR